MEHVNIFGDVINVHDRLAALAARRAHGQTKVRYGRFGNAKSDEYLAEPKPRWFKSKKNS